MKTLVGVVANGPLPKTVSVRGGTYLFINWYNDSSPERQAEYLYCLQRNLDNPLITGVFLVMSENMPTPLQHKKITVWQSRTRPSYSSLFLLAYEFCGPQATCILSNTDIYFDETLELLNKVNLQKCVVALTRWDIQPDGTAQFHNRQDSQDVWIWSGMIKVNAMFPMGMAGCDNRVAHEIHSTGRHLYNPSHTIKAYHYHITNKRNYMRPNGDRKDVVPRPYMFIQPITLQKMITLQGINECRAKHVETKR